MIRVSSLPLSPESTLYQSVASLAESGPSQPLSGSDVTPSSPEPSANPVCATPAVDIVIAQYNFESSVDGDLSFQVLDFFQYLLSLSLSLSLRFNSSDSITRRKGMRLLFSQGINRVGGRGNAKERVEYFHPIM
jgi:hypothetical protein